MVGWVQPGASRSRWAARSSSAIHSPSPSLGRARAGTRGGGRAGRARPLTPLGDQAPLLVPVACTDEPAGRDHLRQVERVLGPEGGRTPRRSGRSPARRGGARQPRPSSIQSIAMSGSGSKPSATGPATTGSSSIRSRSRLKNVPCWVWRSGPSTTRCQTAASRRIGSSPSDSRTCRTGPAGRGASPNGGDRPRGVHRGGVGQEPRLRSSRRPSRAQARGSRAARARAAGGRRRRARPPVAVSASASPGADQSGDSVRANSPSAAFDSDG